MKTPRFIREYANWKMRQLESNELMMPELKVQYKNECKKIVGMRERGLITTDETMLLLGRL